MNSLAMQVSFTLPLNLPLIAVATLYRQQWFYPALMIAVGSHYLPFMFLHGIWQFGILAGTLVTAGILIGMYLPSVFSLGGWLTALLLLVFAFIGRSVAFRDKSV